MMDFFGKSQVFQILEEALDEAERMRYDYEYLEDGICVTPTSKH
jgi:hypothetical protein